MTKIIDCKNKQANLKAYNIVDDDLSVQASISYDASENKLVISADSNTITIDMSQSKELSSSNFIAGNVTIQVSDWQNNSCTVTASGVTVENMVILSPEPASMSAYAAAGVQCTAQGANTLTFTCTTTPTSSLTINFIVL